VASNIIRQDPKQGTAKDAKNAKILFDEAVRLEKCVLGGSNNCRFKGIRNFVGSN